MKRSDHGDIRNMRGQNGASQSNGASALPGGVSTMGGVADRGGPGGDLQSDTWSVDAYASEEGSEPPPETTSVERLSVCTTNSYSNMSGITPSYSMV